MKHLSGVVALTLAALLSASCGGENGIGCDFREGSLNGPEDRCQERRGFQSMGYGGACEAAGGETLDDGCPREDIVGGCDLGQDVFDWYYPPTTVDDINCDSGEVLDPP
jgi:hypothetical protein